MAQEMCSSAGVYVMTIMDLLDMLTGYQQYLSAYFIGLPLLSFVYGRLVGRQRRPNSPHKYVYCLLIYLTSVPGIFAAVITAYTLFFIQTNLLLVNALVYFLPIISMFVTLVLIRKDVDLDHIPGFDRLLGLFTLLVITFVLALMIQKTRIWLLFGSSLSALIILVVFLFGLLKWAIYSIFRQRGEPVVKPPSFPEM